MSFEGELAPSFTLHCLGEGRELPDGWGLGYYPSGEPSAAILKEPGPPQASIRSQLALAWEQVESNVFLLHIRRARWGVLSDANTQPFSRAWGRRDWLIGHAGSLDQRPETTTTGPNEPVGSTDTEQMFCMLLNRFFEKGWRSLMEVDLAELHGWLTELNKNGELTMCLTDGRDMIAHADHRGVPLWVGLLIPPYEKIAFGDNDLDVDLTRRGAKSRKGAIVCSDQLLARDGDADKSIVWRQLAPGLLLMIREGAIIAERTSEGPVSVARSPHRPMRAEKRTFEVVHRTVYKYTKPIERSTHVLRLTPIHDRLQNVISSELHVSVPTQSREYEDVFGNRVRRLEIDTAFDEMVIECKSRVEVLDTDPLGFGPLRVRSTIPLVWMPWQRQVLDPYLLPVELPETQLSDLAEYAMSFVKRNDHDLLDTLLDINQTIKREYLYKQGVTTLLTTAFETYSNRRGVCQDFTNLMICLARLLGVPARYVCGYIYTGPKNQLGIVNTVQSEASHAWVQLYLPQVGWKGFDPTNGILTQTDHVRVAVGRNYIDATPTSGTIFVGGGGETLSVDVKVEPHVG